MRFCREFIKFSRIFAGSVVPAPKVNSDVEGALADHSLSLCTSGSSVMCKMYMKSKERMV